MDAKESTTEESRRNSSKATDSAASVKGKPSPSTKGVEKSGGQGGVAHWRRFFEKQVNPDTVQEVVTELIDNRHYEEAVTCLEQAILSGQIQPWMHPVLALAMEAAGRPKSQIERVLLSSQDLMSNDPASMMHLAAYLARFDRNERAIELYRQAAALAPSRPEPYILALQLAARTKNYSAIAWSAPEVLAYSWGKDGEQLNRLAEQSATEAEDAFLKAGDVTRAMDLRNAMQNARQLDLVVRLDWSGQGDLDMQIAEPTGTVCSAQQPMTASGGIFVHDGFGPRQDNCYEEYLCPQGLNGEYRVIVKHVSGTIVGKRARLTVIRDKGTNREQSVSQTIFLSPTDQTVRFSLSHGRRRVANAEQQSLDQKTGSKPRFQSPVLAQIGNAVTSGQAAVGANAVGFTPGITTISEGIRMSAMAVVSGDRRYVRITAQPEFSTITDVFTFTPVR